MRTHILIFSIVRDIPYLEYCLRSIKKFATGFTGVTIAVPIQEKAAFLSWSSKLPEELVGIGTVKFYTATEDRRFWHILHQGEKCRADHYVPSDTDLILFTDSDCVFTAPVTPLDYLVDGKPELLIKEYTMITGNPWQKPTEEILQQPCLYSTMERHPAVHWSGMFSSLRGRVESLHRMDFTSFVLTRKPDYAWGISEFNLMGSHVLSSEWKDRYHTVDVTNKPHPQSSQKLVQFWSHSPVDKPQSTPWGLNLTPMEVFQKLGL